MGKSLIPCHDLGMSLTRLIQEHTLMKTGDAMMDMFLIDERMGTNIAHPSGDRQVSRNITECGPCR